MKGEFEDTHLKICSTLLIVKSCNLVTVPVAQISVYLNSAHFPTQVSLTWLRVAGFFITWLTRRRGAKPLKVK